MQQDYDLIRKHRDRVLVGLSLTATPSRENRMAVVEPNASTITQRLAALRKAHRLGLRTYGMLCPLLPGIADDHESISELVGACMECGAEEFFVEPVNARGAGLETDAGGPSSGRLRTGSGGGRKDSLACRLVALLRQR